LDELNIFSRFQEILDSSSKQLNSAKHIFASIRTIPVSSSEVERRLSVAQMTGMVAERKCFEIFRQRTWFVNEVSHGSDCSISTQPKPRAQPFNLFFTVAYAIDGFSGHYDVFNIC